jgi:hypothetical protein
MTYPWCKPSRRRWEPSKVRYRRQSTCIEAGDTEATAWYKNRNQAISGGLTSFWQDIYARIAAGDTEVTAWYANRNQAMRGPRPNYPKNRNPGAGYGSTSGAHNQEIYDRKKEGLYKKYRCGVELKKLEWPVSCFVLCVIFYLMTPLCFTEAVQVPGDGLLRAGCASMGRRCKIG